MPAQEAQQAPAAAEESTSPVAPQPAIKTQEELNGLQAILTAASNQARIDAVDAFVEKFPKSEWLGFALQLGAVSYQQMNDYENLMIYGERALEADPNSYQVMLAMATALAQRTREFDLDKEEKLSRATELANDALKTLSTALRPNANITDAQWEAAKNDLTSQAYEALGMVAMIRENYEEAVDQFKKSIDMNTNPVPVTQVRLGSAYINLGNYGEAMATLDAALANPELQGQARELAQTQRDRAEKMQAEKATP
jgi:tetratricopeptide (TPR) repeat protein